MRITVFTPTYNRAYIIDNLYRSLQRQTYTGFEWLVVDDGSVDDTEELFLIWKQENNPFPIKYYKKENGGKQRAINYALDLAEGELFFTVDSDDCLTDDALEKINRWERELPKNGVYCGFAGSDGDLAGNHTNPVFHKPYVDATFFDRDPGCDTFIGYDRPWVFYTAIHRKYKYPEFEGEKFITEAVPWNRMAKDGYLVRCFDDVVYLREHQPDGYTSSILKTLVNNPCGYGLWKKEWMEFRHVSGGAKFREYYSFYCDMRGQYAHDRIAEFIGAPRWLMVLFSIYYKLKHR